MTDQMQNRAARVSGWFNCLACFALVVMMVLSLADVILRRLGAPIPGTYELVGFIGSLVVSFSLADTSVKGGHIAVELIYEKLALKGRIILDVIGNLTGGALFLLLAWQMFGLGGDLKASGEVSATLQMPIHPFVYGSAAGCLLLALVLIAALAGAIRKGVKS